MRLPRLFFWFLPCAALLLACPAWAIPAAKDATIYGPTPDDAAAVTRSDGRGPGLAVGSTVEGAVRRVLMSFDLSSIPAGSVITGVTLTLNLSKGALPTSRATVSLHRLLESWGEGPSNSGSSTGVGASSTAGQDATWNDRFHQTTPWSTPGGTYLTLASAVTNVGMPDLQTNDPRPVRWSGDGLIADVQAWLNNPTSNFGWIFIGDETRDFTGRKFDSGEATATGTYVPQLTIAFTVPEPSTGAWLAITAGVLGCRRRRQRSAHERI